ncbi:hypothetical protein EDC56_0598 [Sinobacterium caligoides]|uniref:Uncharacterized protein n=1 Tax=Sinobacterium caligoides TaxID=933926 RepID=A0A3N2DYX7_9GAMM|nr:hypothetical protein [Sinobacterium caligoides]ROS05076.1 hypothetical protein EDC56_0598 [Sinobacterium caligoides]
MFKKLLIGILIFIVVVFVLLNVLFYWIDKELDGLRDDMAWVVSWNADCIKSSRSVEINTGEDRLVNLLSGDRDAEIFKLYSDRSTCLDDGGVCTTESLYMARFLASSKDESKVIMADEIIQKYDNENGRDIYSDAVHIDIKLLVAGEGSYDLLRLAMDESYRDKYFSSFHGRSMCRQQLKLIGEVYRIEGEFFSYMYIFNRILNNKNAISR